MKRRIMRTLLFQIALTVVVGVVASYSAAGTYDAPPKLNAVASYVAGHPVTVKCGADEYPGVLGYVWESDRSTVYLSTYACQALSDPTSLLFGGGLNILAHEASHARGIDSEAVAGCWGLLLPQDLARRFYAIPFYTPASANIAAAAKRIFDQAPEQYHALCK